MSFASRTITLGADVETGRDIVLDTRGRLQGLYVIGKQGMGKTNFLLSLMLQDAKADQGFCFLDPHGDAIDDLLGMLPEHRLRDVVLLDAGNSDCVFGVNFFQLPEGATEEDVAKRAEQAVGVFRKLWGQESWGPLLEDLLYNCSYTLIANPGCTMYELPKLLADDSFRRRLVANVENDVVRDFWRQEYDPLPDRDKRDYRRSTLNKVRRFVTNPVMRRIVGQSTSTFDFRAFMDEGKIVLVKLPIGELDPEPVNLLGSVMVGLLLTNALGRADTRERHEFFLYADEYDRFATKDFATLITQARKYGIATTTAHQNRRQLKAIGQEVAEISAANLVVFGVSGEDADELKLNFNAEPKQELVGYLPKQVISPQPVEDLVRRWPDNPAIQEIVRGRLVPLVNRSRDECPAHEPVFVYYGGEPYNYRPSSLRYGIEQINRFLLHMMRGELEVGSLEEAVAGAGILETLRGWIGLQSELRSIEMRGGSLYEPTTTEEWREVPLHEEQRDVLRKMMYVAGQLLLHAPDRATGKRAVSTLIFQLSQVERAKFAQKILERIDQREGIRKRTDDERSLSDHVLFSSAQYAEVLSAPFNRYGSILNEVGSRLSEEFCALSRSEQHALVRPQAEAVIRSAEKIPAAYRDLYERVPKCFSLTAYKQVTAWGVALVVGGVTFLELGRLLQREPLLIASSETVPQYRQRPVADIRNELANTLGSLPVLRAYCKLLKDGTPEEHWMRTELVAHAPAPLRSVRVETAREQTRRGGYCRPKHDVDDEIRGRSGEDDPSPEGPERWGEE